MAIQLLSLPTLVGGVTAGYPQYVTALKNKINELATAMSISPLTLSATLGAGSPASDFNTTVAKVNELIGNVNGAPVTPPATGKVLSLNVEGDSLSSPRELSAEWFAQTQAAMQSSTYTGWFNFAVAGDKILGGMNSDAERNAILAKKSATAINVIFLLQGMNDSQLGYNENEVFNLNRDQIGFYNSNGYVVCLVTITASRVEGSSYDHLEFWQRIQKLNNLFRSGFNDGSLPLAILLDTMTDPVLNTFNAPLNTSYFLNDRIHYAQPAGHARLAAFAKRALPYLLAGTKKVINYAGEADQATIQPVDTTGTGTGGIDPQAERITLDAISTVSTSGTSRLTFRATTYNTAKAVEYSLGTGPRQSSNIFSGVANGTYEGAAWLAGTNIKGTLSITVNASIPVYAPLRYGNLEKAGIVLPNTPTVRTIVFYIKRKAVAGEVVLLLDNRQVLYDAGGNIIGSQGVGYIATTGREALTYYVNGNSQSSVDQQFSLAAVFTEGWNQIIIEGDNLSGATLLARFSIVVGDQGNICTDSSIAPISLYGSILSASEKAALSPDQMNGGPLAYYSLEASTVQRATDPKYSQNLLDSTGNGYTAHTIGNMVRQGAA